MIMCIKYISGQTTDLDHLRAHFHSDRGLYPESGLSQGCTDSGPVVFILTVVYILTVVSSFSDCSQQHSPHFLFFSLVLSCCTKIYVYVNMLGRNDLNCTY